MKRILYVCINCFAIRFYAPNVIIMLTFYSWDGVRLSSLGMSASRGPTLLAPDDGDEDDDNECGVVGGMGIGRRNLSTRIKPAHSATFSATYPT